VLEKHHVFGDKMGRTCEVLFTDRHYSNRRVSCLAFRLLLFEENQLVAWSSGIDSFEWRWETHENHFSYSDDSIHRADWFGCADS